MKKRKENIDPKMIKLGVNMTKTIIKKHTKRLVQFNVDLEEMLAKINNNPGERLSEEDIKNLEEQHSFLKDNFCDD